MPRAVHVSAPARANLIGNPSDLSGGAILSCSVPLRARVTIEPAEATELVSGDLAARIESPRDLQPRGDELDLGRVALGALGPLPRVRVSYASEIPMQSGLAGSTALLVALLEGLGAWLGQARGRYQLAELARRVERDVLGVTCGWVDSYLCTFGGLRYVDFRGKQDAEPSRSTPFATVESLEAHVKEIPFLLAWTGVRHDSGAVHAPARARLERGDPELLAAHRRMAELARLGKRALLDADWDRLGALMNENHALQRGLGGSGEVNDRLIEAALTAGARGAKLAGAGHGGTIVALWPGADMKPLERALLSAGAPEVFRPAAVPGVTLEGSADLSTPAPDMIRARG